MTHHSFSQKLLAFFRLIRWKNLLMVVVTMIVARYALLGPLLFHGPYSEAFGKPAFIILMLSALFVMAGGNIINDCFDLKIDRINKPGKVVIGRYFSHHTAISIHQIFSATGILLGFYAGYLVGSYTLGGLHAIGVAMLWYYSFKYKAMPLWGNLVVALLSAMIIPLVWLFAFFALRDDGMAFAGVFATFSIVNRFVAGYFVFSFLLSWSREIVKDVSDIRGDQQEGYHTLAIKLGEHRAMRLAALLMLIAFILLVFISIAYLYSYSVIVFYYSMVFLCAPMLWLIILSCQQRAPGKSIFIQNGIKALMVMGILSILFINLH